MAYDSLTLSLLVKELKETLTTGKINKIVQPERDEIVFYVYRGGVKKLLISANASLNRIHLTREEKQNPPTAPAFCMLLRKHLTGAEISAVEQMPYERVVDFTLNAKDELGYAAKKHLIFELTGKTANVILTKEDYTIIDTLKHIPVSMDAKRILLAGVRYEFFEGRDKITIEEKEKISELILSCEKDVAQLLGENLLGVSTATVEEIVYGAQGASRVQSANTVIENLDRIKEEMASPRPNIVFQKGETKEVYPFEYKSVRGEKKFYDTLNEAHDEFYILKDSFMRFAVKSKNIYQTVKNAVNRLIKKIALQKQDLLKAQDYNEHKTAADLILSNIHLLPKQAAFLQATDYSQEHCPTVNIALDATKTPQQNAQEYYKKYRKQKSAVEHITQQISQSETQLEHIESISQALKICSADNELDEIQKELAQANFIKEKGGKDKKSAPSQPLKFVAYGYTILAGKNNAQNDTLVSKTAKPEDMWLHTHGIHSAHTLIISQGSQFPPQVILAAAEITAYYSQARESGKTVIDYTLRKNLKKPPKARLGFVIYNEYQTIIVLPNAHTEFLVKQ